MAISIRYFTSVLFYSVFLSSFCQTNQLNIAIDEEKKASKEIDKAQMSMIESDKWGMGSAAFSMNINDAQYSISKCQEYCANMLKQIDTSILLLDYLGCTESANDCRKASTLAKNAVTELSKAETGFSSAAGAANVFYRNRVYSEASSEISTARRYLQMTADEMTTAWKKFSICLNKK